MTKQSLIKALQQQLTQIEDLTEKQLNRLLERLESQKAKLPLEDHAIIGWGISIIRTKVQEEEQLRKKVSEIFSKYHSIETFIVGLVGEGFCFNNPTSETRLRHAGKDELVAIVNESHAYDTNKFIEDYVPLFKEYLRDFCASQERATLYSNWIEKYIKFFESSASCMESPKLAFYYRSLSEELSNNEG
ncbi:hypothetical protein C7B65_22050 [Phormidesmis priestleyi ULC007]|uniref:Uncharacterized protein n=1 Tax=Phormidesmis priestleyi ULC007 TaxID=1920490 RepID=A0A2T1D746_9CYAN|nr:hypothetical protein [Phormidesmis priestleyi]PSB16310.1 hypothetical protein C7B65_22050 [Phormidesmis priestleyi ULC007]PZO46991.1 MAG: hypothetical protein DCF14_21110 [Phormidesmis priestleyi]